MKKKICTQKDIARIVGVSQRAVASVVGTGNPGSNVGPEKRQQILEVADKLGYRPHRGAQLFRGVPSGLIGLIKPAGAYEHNISKYLNLAEEFNLLGYKMISVDLLLHLRGLDQALEYLWDARVEGLVICQTYPAITESPGFRLFQQAQTPIVLLNRAVGQSQKQMHCVYADYYQGAQLLMRHLLDQGYRSITMLYDNRPLHQSVSARVRAYKKVMAEAGLTADLVSPPLAERQESTFSRSMELGQSGMELLLQRRRPPEAVCCQNDLVAYGALSRCRHDNIAVPEAIALTGFDDLPLARYAAPPLTSVAHPVKEIATEAARLMVRLIRGQQPQPENQDIVLPCLLRPRASTGWTETSETRTAGPESPGRNGQGVRLNTEKEMPMLSRCRKISNS